MPFLQTVATNKTAPLKILLCGYGPLGLALLQGLLMARGEGLCEIVAVFRWSDVRKPGQAKTPECFLEDTEVALAKRCKVEGVRCLQGDGLNGYAFSTELLRLQPDVVLIGSWGEILQPHLVNSQTTLLNDELAQTEESHPAAHVVRKPMFINCHPSLLPAHRGANPYASVILAGENQTGISFHRIVATIDAGPIILQAPFTIDEIDTGQSIRQRCADLALSMLPELLSLLKDCLEDGKPLQESSQNECKASLFYAPLSQKVNWRDNPQSLSRFLRARFPWAQAYSPIFYGLLRLYFGPAQLQAREALPASDSAVKRSPASAASAKPGEILAHSQDGAFVIATQDATLALQVSDPRIALHTCTLPAWMNTLLKRLLLPVGYCFQETA